MGGLGPGIGGFEYLVIALVALLVVGPERLPLMLRKLGQWVAKARAMANEFRSSFDEMARQSELDELRKEVEALRRGQSNLKPLGAEAEAAFRDIRDDLSRPLDAPTPAPALSGPEEWPDSAPVTPLLDSATSSDPKPAVAEPAVENSAADGSAAQPAKSSRKSAAARPTQAGEASKTSARRKSAPTGEDASAEPAAKAKPRKSGRKAIGS